MHRDPGHTWAVGAIANEHVLAHGGRWVPLNYRAQHQPWQPGDVVHDHAFTGAGWVPLPPGWRADPTGRHQFRWWTGRSWGSRVQTHGLQLDDPLAAAAPPQVPVFVPPHQMGTAWSPVSALLAIVDARNTMAWVLYGGFWLVVAIYSASTAAIEDDPRHLLLTATASLNILLFRLTGRTRSELNRRAARAVRRNLPYLVCGAIAAGGVWLGLHFDDPDLMLVFLSVALIALVFAWAFN